MLTPTDLPTPASPPGHRRVLVVDDETLIRWCLVETLKCDGIDVDEAGDAAGALRAVENAAVPYDVVLLDVRLPDMDGFIVMSAHAPLDLLERALHLGAFCVMAKPFALGEMEAHVARALSGGPRPALQPAS